MSAEPLAEVAIGASSGAISGQLTDLGIDDDFMKNAANIVQSCNDVLFPVIRNLTTDKMLGIKGYWKSGAGRGAGHWRQRNAKPVCRFQGRGVAQCACVGPDCTRHGVHSLNRS